MKKPRPIQVLFVSTESEAPMVDELARGLRRIGHKASIAFSTEEALGQPTPEVLVVTEAAGSSLFRAFALPTGAPRGLFLSPSRDFDAAATATRRGAAEVLAAPTIDELADAVERTPETARASTTRELELHTTPADSHRAVLELLAFATQLGLGRSLRLRLATAASELITRAKGPLTLTAGLAGDPLGVDRLVLRVTDFGRRLDQTADDGFPSGLDFVRTLSERLDLSHDAHAAMACAEFVLAETHFDEDPAGLDELDYFDPTCLRELHSVLGDPEEDHGRDLHRLAPAAAPTFARLMAAGMSHETALFETSTESGIQS